MVAELQAMLTHQILHAAYTGQDGYGVPIHAAAVLRPCRLEWKLRTIVTTSGQERLSQSRVFFNGDFAMDVRDQLVMPDGTKPQILRINAVSAEDGSLDHYEVYL